MTLFKVLIPKDAAVLLLEDSPMRIAWFEKRVPNLHVVSSARAFIDYFASRPTVDFIFFDHDLGEGNGTGLEAAQWMTNEFGGKSKWGLIHSWNREGARQMQAVLGNIYHIPFGEFEVEVEE